MTSTSFCGIPTEARGVSTSSGPTIRPYKFEEAAFGLADGQALTLENTVNQEANR